MSADVRGPLIVRIVGSKDSGKTSLASALIELLRQRGHRVGAVKHSHHPAAADQPGSDTARLFEVGAEPAVFVGPDASLVRYARPLTLLEAVRLAGAAAEIVIVEGFSAEHLGVEVRLSGGPDWSATLVRPDGSSITRPARDIDAIADAIEACRRLAEA